MPQITTLDLRQDFGSFVLEPLERGYGQTIGNTLRRVLYSSIPGAAVCAIKIDKVFHEFSAIPGVKEDTTELILNLRDLAVKVHTDSPPSQEIVLRVDVKGPGRVTGADVVCPDRVEIMNPDCYLATISDPKASLSFELYVGWGTGYVLPDKHEAYKGMIGMIPIGSQFTPVRKVNYSVEATRVGMRTDFERLVLDVWTNGTIWPNDAVTQAAMILDKYFRMFFDLGQAGVELVLQDDEEAASDLQHVPELKIEELDFSQRTFNCLRRAGILNLRNLAMASESDLTAIRGFGKKSLNEVKEKLAEHGLTIKPPRGGARAIDLLDDEEDEDFE